VWKVRQSGHQGASFGSQESQRNLVGLPNRNALRVDDLPQPSQGMVSSLAARVTVVP
jgi:hypothetical protein